MSGCTTERTLPAWDPEAIDRTATRPLPACEYPDFVPLEVGGVAYNALDRDGFVQYLACLDIADAATLVASNNADSIVALLGAIDSAIAIGGMQKDYAEFLLAELEADRRAVNAELWVTRGLLALVLVAVAL